MLDIKKITYDELRNIRHFEDKVNIASLIIALQKDNFKYCEFLFGNLNYEQSTGLFDKESKQYLFTFTEYSGVRLEEVDDALNKVRNKILKLLEEWELDYLKNLYEEDTYAVTIENMARRFKKCKSTKTN